MALRSLVCSWSYIGRRCDATIFNENKQDIIPIRERFTNKNLLVMDMSGDFSFLKNHAKKIYVTKYITIHITAIQIGISTSGLTSFLYFILILIFREKPRVETRGELQNCVLAIPTYSQ